jgi:hypothetical protein
VRLLDLLSTTEALQDLVLHVGDGGGVLVAWCEGRRPVVVVLRRAGSGDRSLLSSVPGRPKMQWWTGGWTLLGQRLCYRERVESGGPLRICTAG